MFQKNSVTKEKKDTRLEVYGFAGWMMSFVGYGTYFLFLKDFVEIL
jgi:hypothetical protein